MSWLLILRRVNTIYSVPNNRLQVEQLLLTILLSDWSMLEAFHITCALHTEVDSWNSVTSVRSIDGWGCARGNKVEHLCYMEMSVLHIP